MATLVLAPIQDTSLWQGSPNSNYGTADIEVYDRVGHIRRLLLAFDMSQLHTDAIVSAAMLRLYHSSKSYEPGGKGVDFYLLERPDWSESEATWNAYKASSAWTTAGGDYSGSPATGIVPMSPDQWMEVDVSPQVLLALASGPRLDLLGRMAIEDVPSRYARALFRSREYGTEAVRPQLVLTYSMPVFPYVGLPYRVEVHDSDGHLIAIPRAVFAGKLTRGLNAPDALSFQIAADDPACQYMTPQYELWVKNNGAIVSIVTPVLTEASNQ